MMDERIRTFIKRVYEAADRRQFCGPYGEYNDDEMWEIREEAKELIALMPAVSAPEQLK